MKNIILSILFLNVLISCEHKLNSVVENAVNAIVEKDIINSDSFWTRRESSYKNFLNVSTIDDLVYLTNHENPRVRYYAFLGLIDKNYPKIKDIYFKHENDAESIYTTNGACLRNNYDVNELMLWELDPKDSEFKYCFTLDEYDKEYDKITK